MAILDISLDFCLGNEGFYSDDPNDSGGETLYGIARKKNPFPEFWSIVDSYKGNSNFPNCLKGDEKLKELRNSFYTKQYWYKIDGDNIDDQDLANQALSMAINAGVGVALKLLREA